MTALPAEIDALRHEQQALRLRRLDANIAWEIGAFIRQRVVADTLPIAFEVSRPGQQLFFYAAEGTTPDNASWVRRKRNVVERFHKSSLEMHLQAQHDGRPMLERYALPVIDFCSSGGSVPIILEGGGCVGAVTVSGLTQHDDHALAVAAIRSVMESQAQA
jgi:uncharacterized protein (UPF0303 family)